MAASLVVSLAAATAQADIETLELDYRGQEFQAGPYRPDVLFLKAKAEQQHGYRHRLIDMIKNGSAKLESVRLVAKSRMGHGRATLTVGHNDQSWATIDNKGNYYDNSRWSYDTVFLRNWDQWRTGPWQIDLVGNIKVDSVTLFIDVPNRWDRDRDDRGRGPGRGGRDGRGGHGGRR